MTALQYRPQLQQQHQEGEGDAAPAGNLDPTQGPVADGAGDDDIIADLLKSDRKQPRERQEREPRRREPEPDVDEPTDTEDPPEPDYQDEEEPEEPTPDDDEDLDEEDVPEAAEREEEDAPTGSSKAARAALKAGDIDKAFMLAFGKRPEDVVPNSHAWTAWRKANDREAERRQKDRSQIDADRAQLHHDAHQERLKIHNTIEALKPYEKFYVAEQAWQREGDPSHLVTIITGITGMSYDEAQKLIITRTKRSPAERAMAEKLQALERKLQETTQEREQQAQNQTAQQTYANDLQYIRQHVTGSVTKVPKFAERIYNVLAKTRNAAGLTLTVEQAAARVVKAEKRRIENHPFVRRKPKPGAPSSSSTPARRPTTTSRPALRRDSQNNGAPNKDAETDDDIINDILSNRRRAG